MFKKKKPNKFILSCKWKQNFRHSQLAAQKYETLLEEAKQILETVSAINIFTSRSDEKKNTSPPRHIPWQHKNDTYHLLQIKSYYTSSVLPCPQDFWCLCLHQIYNRNPEQKPGAIRLPSVLQNGHKEGKGEAYREVCETTAQRRFVNSQSYACSAREHHIQLQSSHHTKRFYQSSFSSASWFKKQY